MKILFCGDVFGRSGRDAIKKYIPSLRAQLNLDFVIVNGENTAHGFGITEEICKDFYALGVDVITTGNHLFDQKNIISYIGQDKRLLRPLNFPASTPGQGFGIYEVKPNLKIMVINVMGTLFMDPLDNPFVAVLNLLNTYTLGQQVQAIFIDFHGEASSEKYAMGYMVDGQVSAMVGSHTHVPTADHHILPKGTAYQTDAGMVGDYRSVIGMNPNIPILKFVKRYTTERATIADGEATLCGTIIEIDDKTGLAFSIEPIRLGGVLQQKIV